jgi:hypothetical protein
MRITELAPKIKARRIDVLIGRTVRDYMDDFEEEQADLGRLLEIDQSGVSKKLRGSVKFSPWELFVIAAHYGVTVDELYKRTRDEGAMEVHPLGLEPRTHCLSVDGEPRGELVSLDVARAARRAGTAKPVAS